MKLIFSVEHIKALLPGEHSFVSIKDAEVLGHSGELCLTWAVGRWDVTASRILLKAHCHSCMLSSLMVLQFHHSCFLSPFFSLEPGVCFCASVFQRTSNHCVTCFVFAFFFFSGSEESMASFICLILKDILDQSCHPAGPLPSGFWVVSAQPPAREKLATQPAYSSCCSFQLHFYFHF